MFVSLFLRSLPGGVSPQGAVPPVHTEDDSATSAMAKKTASKPMLLPILIPVAIALGVYLLLFHLILPTWRAHRERYRQYLPLHASERIVSRLPPFLHPQTLSRVMHNIILRIFFPSTWAASHTSASNHNANTGTTTYRRSSTSSSVDSPLFSAEHGEAMVGFDVPSLNNNNSLQNTNTQAPSQTEDPREANRRRRENMERFAGRNMAFARGMTGQNDDGIREGRDAFIHPERRLNRELEAGFMDDSDDENDEESDARGVTVGRRSFSANR